MRNQGLVVTIGIACALGGVVIYSQNVGIQPLTAERFADAKVDPSKQLNSPVAIRMAAIDALDVKNRDYIRGKTAKPEPPYPLVPPEGGSIPERPFEFIIETPYSRAVTIARGAALKFVEPKFPTLAVLNAGRVTVLVKAGPVVTTADAIMKVVIKRDGIVIRPLKTTIAPTVVETLMGVKKASAVGTFTFDYATFDPSTAITIAMVGRKGNFEWTMPPEELKQLK